MPAVNIGIGTINPQYNLDLSDAGTFRSDNITDTIGFTRIEDALLVNGFDVDTRFSHIEDDSANYKTAYSHSQTTTGNPHSLDKSDVGLGNVPNTDHTAKTILIKILILISHLKAILFIQHGIKIMQILSTLLR